MSVRARFKLTDVSPRLLRSLDRVLLPVFPEDASGPWVADLTATSMLVRVMPFMEPKPMPEQETGIQQRRPS